ncbi:MAG: hypothetical protein AB7V77_01735 [Candidatus Woesearchaeota archaeon]
MAKEILGLHWTTNKGFKKGELVMQKEGIFVYKTAKRILRGIENFREIVYAEIPFDIIENVYITKSGLMKKHVICFKLEKESFHKLLNEKHSVLFKAIINLFNRNNVIYFPVLMNTFDEINTFVKFTKERMK